MPTKLLVYGWALFSVTKESEGCFLPVLASLLFLGGSVTTGGRFEGGCVWLLKVICIQQSIWIYQVLRRKDRGVAYWESPSEKYEKQKNHTNHSPHHHHPCHWLTGSMPFQHWGQELVCLLQQEKEYICKGQKQEETFEMVTEGRRTPHTWFWCLFPKGKL